MIGLGIVLVVVALVLLLAEAHLSTAGVIAGVAFAALLAGVTVLLVGAGAGLLVVLAIALSVLGASLAAVVILGRSLASVRRLRPRSGRDGMLGHIGVVRAGGAAARVFVDGALWRAQPSHADDADALHAGDRVVVERVSGLTLGVRKAEEWELMH